MYPGCGLNSAIQAFFDKMTHGLQLMIDKEECVLRGIFVAFPAPQPLRAFLSTIQKKHPVGVMVQSKSTTMVCFIQYLSIHKT
jgi:hypothetical protein